ncbi:TPA: hypothetical protein ACF24T_004171 [Escherichia coli]
MNKSLNARCIRRWEIKFKPIFDSKVSPHMRKSFLRGMRELGLITAENMVESMAEKNAKFDYDGKDTGWSPEFSNWYEAHREKYRKEARDHLDEEATNDEIDKEIETELESWND